MVSNVSRPSLLLLVCALAGLGCGRPAPDCASLDYDECEEAEHCQATHEDSDETGAPGFSCDPIPRR